MDVLPSRWNRDLLPGRGATILLLIFSIFTYIFILIWWKNRRYWFLASKIPGPPSYPLIGNVYMFVGISLVECFNLVKKLHKQYGPIVRIWGGPKLIVFVSDPETVERTIGSKKFDNRGGYVYQVAKPLFNNGLLLSRGEIWRSHRKLITSAFHNNVLESFVENFSKNTNILVDQLMKKADGTTFDLYPHMFNCALDIIVETTSGLSINAQTEANSPYAKYMLRCLELMVQRFRQPWLIIERINNLTKLGKEQKIMLEAINKRFEEGIQTKLDYFKKEQTKTDLEDKESIRKKKTCLVDLIVECQMMDKKEIRDETASIIGAGSETSSTTVCYVMSLLGVHHDIQDKVVEEQRRIFHDDIHRPASAADVKEMVYLEKVVKETLRILPPVPWVFRSINRETEIGHGLTLPRGTYCVVNAFDMHRNPEYFPDPERFDPERFSKENSVNRHPYAYVPFGAGRRFCVGFQYAMLETKAMLSTLIREFRVTYTPGGIKGLENRLEAGLVVKPANGFPIQLLPRASPKIS